jgi:signal transduction histidine kinase
MPVTVVNAPRADEHQREGATSFESSSETLLAHEEHCAVIAHELLTPLTCILGWAQEAQTHPEAAEHALAIIESQARRQHRVITRLLERLRSLPVPCVCPLEPTDGRHMAAHSPALES